MTVSATTPQVGYLGNSATTVFSFPFEVPEETDLFVIRKNVSTLAQTMLVLDVDYSVDLNTSEVTYPLIGSPMTSANYLVLRRRAPYVQDTSYDTQGNFSPATLENALDYVTMLVQQVLNQIALGFSVLPSYTVATLPSAISYAPAMIYVSDASGGGIPCFCDGTNWRRVDTRGIVS